MFLRGVELSICDFSMALDERTRRVVRSRFDLAWPIEVVLPVTDIGFVFPLPVPLREVLGGDLRGEVGGWEVEARDLISA